MKTWIEFFQNRFYSLNGLPFFFFDNAMQLIWFTNNVSRFSGIFFIDFQWREIAVISPSKFSIVTFQRKLGPSYKWVPSFKKRNCLLQGKTNIPKHTMVLSLHTGHDLHSEQNWFQKQQLFIPTSQVWNRLLILILEQKKPKIVLCFCKSKLFHFSLR